MVLGCFLLDSCRKEAALGSHGSPGPPWAHMAPLGGHGSLVGTLSVPCRHAFGPRARPLGTLSCRSSSESAHSCCEFPSFTGPKTGHATQARVFTRELDAKSATLLLQSAIISHRAHERNPHIVFDVRCWNRLLLFRCSC